jgi:hypothetical protein
MIYALMGFAHAAVERRVRAIRALAEGQGGQGTVEYVGLILLVSLLMVGMVAAMKGFNRFKTKTRYYRGRLRLASAKPRNTGVVVYLADQPHLHADRPRHL